LIQLGGNFTNSEQRETKAGKTDTRTPRWMLHAAWQSLAAVVLVSAADEASPADF